MKERYARWGFRPVHSEEKVRKAIEMRRAGVKQLVIADELGTSESWVSRVTSGRVPKSR